MGTQPKFWDKLAEKYAAQPVKDEAAYAEKLKRTRAVLRPEHRVLEFGCGTGTTARHHAPHVASVLATDFSAEMIRIAQQNAADAHPNLEFRQCTFEEVSTNDGPFDALMGHSILHLLPDYEGAIAHAFDLLRPGGTFISSTACLKTMIPWFHPVMRPLLYLAGRLGFVPDVNFFSADELRQKIEASGFRVEEMWQPNSTAAVFIIARKPEN